MHGMNNKIWCCFSWVVVVVTSFWKKPEDRASTLLWNVSSSLPIDKASYPGSNSSSSAHLWEPHTSHVRFTSDIVYCICAINHNAYVRGWWWRNSSITTITKPGISLTVSCLFLFMTATATSLRLPDMLLFPASVEYTFFPMNNIRKLTSW
jgi:hypothetical protein